jgi:hypothetical protein
MAVRFPVFATVMWGLLAGVLVSEADGGHWYWGALAGAGGAVGLLLLLGLLTGIHSPKDPKESAPPQPAQPDHASAPAAGPPQRQAERHAPADGGPEPTSGPQVRGGGQL